jgi:DeoR family transcriptional regulator, fructose operon transcriptional repressor
MKDKRISELRQYIRSKGEASLTELLSLYPQTSSMTIRRDLDKLEQEGEIFRTRGGVKSLPYLSGIVEDEYQKRAERSNEQKERIAKKALPLLEEGRSIFIDSGTTMMYFAKQFTRENLFITTSAPNIALECIKNPNASINVVGGCLNRNNLTLAGLNSVDFIKNINIDIAFMAASGFSVLNGFTNGNYGECELKRAVIQKAAIVVVLMDSSKAGINMPFTFAALKDVNFLVSDDNLPSKLAKEIEGHNVKVI